MERLNAWLEAAARTVTLSAEERVVDSAAVARALGYAGVKPRPIPTHVAAAIARIQPLAEELIAGRAVWTVVPADVYADFVLCDRPRGTRLAVGGLVARQLWRSRALVTFVVTIGAALEAEARRLMRQDPLAGFILDMIGSAAVDACADAVMVQVKREVGEFGWHHTNRYSPGYCTWDTADQSALFAILPHAPAGVRLTMSGLMQPLKSVSGVFGVGEEVSFAEYACEFCGHEDCRQRLAAQMG